MPTPPDEITIVDNAPVYEERTPPFYWDYTGRTETPVMIWNEFEWNY
jgi:hypothetical protein